ncbi:MAG: hypothetical protein JNM50_04585 [Chromatiales bacterium]|nr:hypothetical protein [Chromatiales bacterium]
MHAPTPPRLDPAALAFTCLLLPVVTVHACYAIAVGQGHLPLCVTYLQGCTSISATGRYGAAYFLFKGGILPTTTLLAAFWWLAGTWLRALGDTAATRQRWMLGLGLTGAAFLAIYAVALGHKGEVYNLMRRFGVTVYFGTSYLAALLLVDRAWHCAEVPLRLRRALLAVVTVLLVLGLGSIPVSNFVADKDPIENAIEWVFTLLLFGFYGLAGLAFRATGFRLVAGLQPSPRR